MKVYDLVMKEVEMGKGQLILIGGRPAMGKTTFAISTALDMANVGYKVAFVSLEMIEKQLTNRVTMMNSNDNYKKDKIDVFDEAHQLVDDIENKCIGKDYDVIFIDYMQLIGYEDDGIVEIVDDLRAFAEKMACPVIVLSQLSRVVEKREDNRPMLEDLKFSNINVEKFNQVFLIYRSDYYDISNKSLEMEVIMKNGKAVIEWVY